MRPASSRTGTPSSSHTIWAVKTDPSEAVTLTGAELAVESLSSTRPGWGSSSVGARKTVVTVPFTNRLPSSPSSGSPCSTTRWLAGSSGSPGSPGPGSTSAPGSTGSMRTVAEGTSSSSVGLALAR